MNFKILVTKVAIIGLVVSALSLNGCATSDIKNIVSNGNAMSISNNKLNQISPSQVRLFYTKNEIPHHYNIIGRISAENYNIVGIEHTQESIANELKKQAASIGANGVININSGLTQTTADAILIKK